MEVVWQTVRAPFIGPFAMPITSVWCEPPAPTDDPWLEVSIIAGVLIAGMLPYVIFPRLIFAFVGAIAIGLWVICGIAPVFAGV